MKGRAMCRLEDTLTDLNTAVERRVAMDPDKVPKKDLEDADEAVCLKSRRAFTAFVDYAGWFGQPDKQVISEVRGALTRALRCLESSGYPDADQYRASVGEKLLFLDRFDKGERLDRILAAT